MTAVSYSTTSAACARVKQDLTDQGFLGTFGVGRRVLASRSNPLLGAVAVIPTDGPVSPPRLLGGNPRACFTVSQGLEIHCFAAAAAQTDPATQYEADLSAAETLRNTVLRSFEIYIPGAKRGGRSVVTDGGENAYGVEIVVTITIDLETPDTTYELATGTVFVPIVQAEFTHGSTNPADYTFDSGNGP